MRLHAVSIALLNENSEILGVSRKYDHTKMGIIGGKVDDDDFIDELGNQHSLMHALVKAAIRETKEETGLDIYDLEVIYCTYVSGRLQWTFLARWSGEINTSEPHVVKWVDTETLKNGCFADYNMEVIKSLKELGFEIK